MDLAICLLPKRAKRRKKKEERRKKKEERRKKKEEDEETPQWVMEAWEFLLRRALQLPSKDPKWLDLPAMMRTVVTTPNVFKYRRPEWLGPFNFFLFPLLSETFGSNSRTQGMSHC
jgi:hypothetical protein